MNRRHCLKTTVAGTLMAALGSFAAESPVLPVKRKPSETLPALKIYIPAGAGGGWDQTGHALGGALQEGELVKQIAYENKGGLGGTTGLADFVARHRGDPQAVLIGGLVMLGGVAIHHSEAAMKELTPLARLTSDYMVLAVSPGAKLRTVPDLVAQLKRDVASVVFTGGSAGGVDHMLVAMMMRALKLDPAAMKYLPTSSGQEAVAHLVSGQATVAISGYSEFKPAIDDHKLLPLAVSARKSLFGLPSLRELGIDTELANWRAVFAPAGITAAQKDLLRKLVVQAIETPSWRHTLLANNWIGSPLYGQELDRFVEFETGIATVVTQVLKLKT